LLLGLVINTPRTETATASEPTTADDVTTQMAYVAQQRLDGYAEAVAHAIKRKAVFDKRVLSRKPGEVIFSKGQLVQIYRSDLDHTFKTERKLLPKWSPPQRITERSLNSYTLERLDGTPIAGNFSARRLRGFTPREGTKLAEEQAEVERTLVDEQSVVEVEDATVDEEVDDEEEGRQLQIARADTEQSQAARTPPHERGAHGVGDEADKSRDTSRDPAGDLACD
jgi:hypothetical protein